MVELLELGIVPELLYAFQELDILSAFPMSIARRHAIAGRDKLDFTVCARLNIGGTRGAEEGKHTGRRRQKEKQGGREAEQAGKGHGERSGGDRAARGKSETDGSLAGRGGGAIEQL